MEGLPERNQLEPAITWLRRLKFLLIVSAVSGGWRNVALDTAPLWSFIMYQTRISRAADVLEMKTLKEFISRSKDAVIDLTIVLDDARPFSIEPKIYSAMDKRRLEFSPKLREILEQSHRCRSLMLLASDAGIAEAFFPLPPHLPALTDLTVHTNRDFDDPCDPVLSLFPKGMVCQLRAMTITTSRLPVIESIDFCRVHTLSLSVTDEELSRDSVLRILSLLRSLRTLDICGIMDPPLGPRLPITMPNITKITTDNDTHKWFLDSIIAPQLQHLSLVNSGIPKSLCGSLRTLCLTFELFVSVLPMMQSTGSQRDLVAMHLTTTPQCSNEALKYLNGHSAETNFSAGTYRLPYPSLEFVRIVMTGYGWDSSFRVLLEQRPKLTLCGFGVNPGDVIHSWLDALSSDFDSRVLVVAGNSGPTPLSELFSSKR
ncbi:hypothetical protein BS47DRAFT_384354 [Hydnum rufescens UP504]|uniref:F-box domain-containing protein n=1 Tax=Hydnum rufescens UP504 TaxID=1448309 RepID=A0A9P6AJI5_9AGAM|nr:hypothetical protein BS47DRAFT_384354 [Hydnum rufescens UP504]